MGIFLCEWLDDRIDPDGDGLERILELPKEYDEYGNLNTLTVRVDRLSAAVNDLFYYSPAFYLFCMEDGRAYLYADVAVENDYHLLEIFDLSGDAPRWAGEEYGGFGMLWDSEREESALHIPTGPDCFALNKRLHLLSTHTGQRENRIGEDGLPQPAGTLWYTANENAMITLQVVKDIPATIIDEAALSLPAEDMTGTEGYIRAGESVKIWRSDGWSMMDLRREDGSAARIYIDNNDWPHTINGEDESSFFEQLYYAG